ncbi:unnamed protein product, partial [Owenia fusiformis]
FYVILREIQILDMRPIDVFVQGKEPITDDYSDGSGLDDDVSKNSDISESGDVSGGGELNGSGGTSGYGDEIGSGEPIKYTTDSTFSSGVTDGLLDIHNQGISNNNEAFLSKHMQTAMNPVFIR